MVRANDAGTMVSAGQIQLSGPPDSVAVCPVNGVASVKYSYDGGTWVTAFTNIAISLNASKYFGCGAAATNDGATGVSITVSVSYCDVVDAAQLSRTIVSNCTTACIWTTKVRDVSLNVSVASGNLSLIPNPAGGGGPSMKFFAGNYVRAHTHNLSCAAPCDATRHSIYSQASMGSDANIIGTEIWIDWKYLESDAGGDFSAGFTWLHNEINFVKTNYPGKKVGLMLNIAPYGPSALNQAGSWFPAYLANAGCLYMEGSAGASGGSDTINWFKNNSTCLGYYNRMIAAYGAEFDSDVGLAFIRIQQETDDGINNAGISGPAEDAAWKNIALASRNAFPTTPIWIPVNWTGVETAAAKEALLLYYKSIQVGAGNGDTQPKDLAYSCASTAWVCIVLGLNASIGGTNHNNCGEFISMGSVELSEMGYNSVVDPFGGLTSQQVITSWNNDTCQQFGIWEPNFGETGTPATMYWNGANGQKWAIDTIGLTHLTKPAGVP
jgi:hypothetical protein